MDQTRSREAATEAPALLRSLADFLDAHDLADQQHFAFGDGGYLAITAYSRADLDRWASACRVEVGRMECFGASDPFVSYTVRSTLPGQSREFSVLFADHDEAKQLLAEAERSALSDAEDEAWLESKPEPVA